jgi:hypothetical protein
MGSRVMAVMTEFATTWNCSTSQKEKGHFVRVFPFDHVHCLLGVITASLSLSIIVPACRAPC